MTYDRKAGELLRLKAEGVASFRIIIRSDRLIAVVSHKMIQHIVEEYCEDGRKIPGLFLSINKGQYYKQYNDELGDDEIIRCDNGFMYTAVNGYAECTVECFYFESTAIDYLTRDTDYYTLLMRDAKRWSKANNG